MDYHTTILRQIIEIFPRHEFEAIAKGFHAGQKFRSFNRESVHGYAYRPTLRPEKPSRSGHERIGPDPLFQKACKRGGKPSGLQVVKFQLSG